MAPIWIIMAVVTFAATPAKETQTVKLLQSTVAQIGGCSVGLIKIRARESTVTGKTFYLASINVADSATQKEQTYMVGEGNEMKIGTQSVKIKEVRPAPSENERGHVIFDLLAED